MNTRFALPLTAAGTVAAGLICLVPAASASPARHHARPSHRVACALTEDSILTNCHGARLTYHHGRWYAPGRARFRMAGLTAEPCTAAQIRELRVARRDCVNQVTRKITITIWRDRRGGVHFAGS